MIIIYHNYHNVLKAEKPEGEAVDFQTSDNIPKVIHQLAKTYPDELLVWCYEELAAYIHIEAIPEIMHHQLLLAPYHISKEYYLGAAIGFVEGSPFINVNKEVSYPTWQQSGDIGCASSQVFCQIDEQLYEHKDFHYFLNSLAKIYMPLGLLCYSEPKLLQSIPKQTISNTQASFATLFKFVKEHYKSVWSWLLLLNLLVYDKKLKLGAFMLAAFKGKRLEDTFKSIAIAVNSTKKVLSSETVDVIIPTIGRKEYLYDVLNDLKNQTHLPKKVIIVEQNPDKKSISALDYLTTENWPFEIDHTFTHVTGACNARNIALSKVTSDWVFLNDDDNRFEEDLLESILMRLKQYGVSVVATYLQSGEQQSFLNTFQAPFFGSGNSFMKSSLLTKVQFNKALEFGYGEDTEYGLQLRALGEDVLYFSDVHIQHLHAPRGGFRSKFTFEWENEAIQPKPSPTVMYVKQKYDSREQLLSYKTTLFLKFYKEQSIRNPFKYLKRFRQGWKQSVYWANRLESLRN